MVRDVHLFFDLMPSQLQGRKSPMATGLLYNGEIMHQFWKCHLGYPFYDNQGKVVFRPDPLREQGMRIEYGV